jgi:hypothetical protein
VNRQITMMLARPSTALPSAQPVRATETVLASAERAENLRRLR